MERQPATIGTKARIIGMREGGQLLLTKLDEQFPRVELLWTDNGYKSTFQNWEITTLKWRVECVKHPVEPQGEYAELVREFLSDDLYEKRYAKASNCYRDAGCLSGVLHGITDSGAEAKTMRY